MCKMSPGDFALFIVVPLVAGAAAIALIRRAERWMSVFKSKCPFGWTLAGLVVLYLALASCFIAVERCGENARAPVRRTVAQPPPLQVDAATADRSAIAARTDGSPRTASDRDRAMSRLRRASGPADGFGALMRRLHADGGRDERTRNFAVQHLGLHAQELHRRGAYDPRSREAAEIRAALESAVMETANTVAAPAFRALADLAAFDSEVDAEFLESRLVACVADRAASLSARVMAAQICGERRVSVARETLSRLRDDPSTPHVLRLAARRALAP